MACGEGLIGGWISAQDQEHGTGCLLRTLRRGLPAAWYGDNGSRTPEQGQCEASLPEIRGHYTKRAWRPARHLVTWCPRDRRRGYRPIPGRLSLRGRSEEPRDKLFAKRVRKISQAEFLSRRARPGQGKFIDSQAEENVRSSPSDDAAVMFCRRSPQRLSKRIRGSGRFVAAALAWRSATISVTTD